MYKRNEGFRYTFPEPLEGKLFLSKGKDSEKHSNKTNILIRNMSPRGCSFSSGLSFPTEEELLVYIEFTINTEPLSAVGKIAWKKEMGRQIFYGLTFISTDEDSEALTKEIKKFVFQNR